MINSPLRPPTPNTLNQNPLTRPISPTQLSPAYICTECGSHFSSEKYLTLHTQVHTIQRLSPHSIDSYQRKSPISLDSNSPSSIYNNQRSSPPNYSNHHDQRKSPIPNPNFSFYRDQRNSPLYSNPPHSPFNDQRRSPIHSNPNHPAHNDQRNSAFFYDRNYPPSQLNRNASHSRNKIQIITNFDSTDLLIKAASSIDLMNSSATSEFKNNQREPYLLTPSTPNSGPSSFRLPVTLRLNPKHSPLSPYTMISPRSPHNFSSTNSSPIQSNQSPITQSHSQSFDLLRQVADIEYTKLINENINISRLTCPDTGCIGHTFSTPTHLKRHIRECHQQVKVFICTGCGRSFKRKEHMVKHHKAIHG